MTGNSWRNRRSEIPIAALIAAGLDTSRKPDDRNNFGPRAGFSYAFDDKTVVRGGYGLFYGRTTAIMLGTAHSNNGINILGVTLNCTLVPNPCPTYPNIFTSTAGLGRATAQSVSVFRRLRAADGATGQSRR